MESLHRSSSQVPRDIVCRALAANRRQATASLELTMCMPLLVAMLLLILWQGITMVGFSEVTVEARENAWKQRFDHPPGTPLVFLQGDILENARLAESDLVTGDSSRTYKIARVVDWLPSPKSKMTLAAGSWDYRQLPLDELPNWKTHGLMAVSARLGGFQNLISQAGNILNDLTSAADVVSGWQNETLDSLDQGVSDMQNGTNREAEKRKEELRQALKETNDRIAELERQLDDIDRQLAALGVKEGQPAPPEDRGEQDQQEASKLTELQILLAQRARVQNQLQAAGADKRTLEEELEDL